MRKIIWQVTLLICIVLVTWLGLDVFESYLQSHSYYGKLMSDPLYVRLVFRGVVAGLIPAVYLLLAKKASFRGLFFSLVAGGVLFMRLMISKVTNFVWFGFFKVIINTVAIFGLWFGFLFVTTVLWSVLKRKVLHIETESLLDVFIDFWVGLATFLLLQVALLMLTMYFPIVNWVILLAACYGVWYFKDAREQVRSIVNESLQVVNYKDMNLPARAKIIVGLLLVMTFWYFFNGYLQAFMPYSTAWDANHAYMFFPKMWAFNNGLYWYEANMASVPQLWYWFISFWFSLFKPFGGFLGIATDTIAIEMNYFSALYVLILGIALSYTVVDSLKKTKEHVSIRLGTLMGWFLTLCWLMSGMGAFLVFVDNKTDLWVMALIMLAMLSGFVFLKKLAEGNDDETQARKFIGLSGFFYAIAVLAKPTALFDVANFGLYLRWVWFGIIGVIGLVLLIIWWLSLISFRGVKEYISEAVGKVLAGIWWVTTMWALIFALLKQAKRYFLYLFIWAGVLVGTLFVVKLPYVLVSNVTLDTSQWVGDIVRRVLLAQNANQPIIPATCSLETLWMQSTDELYEWLSKPQGSVYNEDVGRYTGFGWKGNDADQRRGIQPYTNPFRAWFFSEWCNGFNPLGRNTSNAVILCENVPLWNGFTLKGMEQVRGMLDPASDEYRFVDLLYQKMMTEPNATPQEYRSKYNVDLQSIRKIMEDNTVKVEKTWENTLVYVPYKFLNPWNITYNRSLQNESSYYTDIGVLRLLLMVFAIIWLIYGLVTRQRQVAAFCGVTVFGWILRWLIAWGIVWYAIGIIVWSILSFVVFISALIDTRVTWRSEPFVYLLGATFLVLFSLVWLRQQGFNMLRISGQSIRTGEMFMRYRMSAGYREVVSEDLQLLYQPTSTYWLQDVFVRQFPHYTPFINAANESAHDEWSWIAGTYSRYFIEDQNNVKYDQFVTWFNEMLSDQDSCATALRLKDQGIRYMAIDPNIGTVVQGDGNKSLFYRFFGRTNPTSGTVEEYGAVTMLTKMVEEGHARLLTTNNIWAKYAHTMPDATFATVPEEQLISFRARMAVARYFGDRNNNRYIDAVYQIADAKVKDGTFIEDVVWLLWLEDVRVNELLTMIRSWQLAKEDLQALSNDERKALQQFLTYRWQAANNPEEYKQTLLRTITNSVYSPNQIIVYEILQ